MEEETHKKGIDRKILYALGGIVLGILAPVGWIILRPLLFWTPGQSFWQQIVNAVQQNPENIALYIYMGGGTAVVLSAFGFFIGRSSQQIHTRAQRLDELNRTVAHQKEDFERRFRELNASIKKFHGINADIQKSIIAEDVLELSANGLHQILGYDRVNIFLVDRKENRLKWVANRGGDLAQKDLDRHIPLDASSGALFRAVQDNRLIHVRESSAMPADFRFQPPLSEIKALRSKNFVLAPFLVNDEVAGLLAIDNKFKKKALDDTDVDTIKLFSDQLSSALTKINLLSEVETLIRELEHTFVEFAKYRQSYSQMISSLKRATAATAESIAEIASGADVISDSVNSTQSASSEISVSIEQVSQNMKLLTDFMENSISAMTQISTTIKNVEASGEHSHQMSETVKAQADEGVRSVGDTMEGLNGISRAVGDAATVIEVLSEKSEEIDSITTVINEITQKTNLLALNAAIIAAQAGEQGRSFGVVAEEIRGLSQETSSSTGAITQIIQEIKDYTRQAVGHIGKTRDWVGKGLDLGQGTERSLRQILDSSVKAMDMTRDIRKSTQEVAHSAEYVSQSIEELGEMASQVSAAFREQAQGTHSIVQSIEEVRSMTEDMVVATAKQEKETREIESGVDSVQDMANRIFNEMEARRKESQTVVKRLAQLREGS